MKFKHWINEIVELAKPNGRVNRRTIIKDKGTNVARQAIQFKWTTSLGNVVKLHFDHDGPNSYVVIFYVNDTLFDDSSNIEGVEGRDPEILSGIFHLLKNKSSKLGAERLSFRAYESDRDTKIIRGIDANVFKKEALLVLDQFLHVLQQYQVKMVPPSERKIALWKRLNRPHPEPFPDFRKDVWEKLIQTAKSLIANNKRLTGVINSLKAGIGTGDFSVINFDVYKLVDILSKFNDAVISNSPEGLSRKRNRRAAIYEKLLNRHMSDDWNIGIDGDRFELMKK